MILCVRVLSRVKNDEKSSSERMLNPVLDSVFILCSILFKTEFLLKLSKKVEVRIVKFTEFWRQRAFLMREGPFSDEETELQEHIKCLKQKQRR